MNAMSDKDSSGGIFDDLLQKEDRPPKVRISFREFLIAYRRKLPVLVKILSVILPITFVAVPVCMHLFGGTNYEAAMTIAPNRMVDPGGDTAAGGLSSLIGLQGPMDTQFELYLSTRKSNLLAERMMATPGVPQKLFAAFWDAKTRQWRPNQGVVATTKRAVIRALGFTAWTAPAAGDLAAYLGNAFVVESNKRTLITKITFSDPDPAFAKWLLSIVHNQAEAILREQAQHRTRIMIEHAVRELGVVTVAEQRLALIGLLSQQEKQLLMIDDKLPYAAVVVDPPSADLQSGPRPLRNIFVALLLVTILAAGALAAQVLRQMSGMKRKVLQENGDYSAPLARRAPALDV